MSFFNFYDIIITSHNIKNMNFEQIKNNKNTETQKAEQAPLSTIKKSSSLKRGLMTAAIPVLSLLAHANTAQATEKPKSAITQKYQEDREQQLSTTKNQIEDLKKSPEYQEYINDIRPSQVTGEKQNLKEYFEQVKQQNSYQESPRQMTGKDIINFQESIKEAKQETIKIKEKLQEKETLEFKYILQFIKQPDLPHSKDEARHIVNELHKMQTELLNNYPLYKYRNLNISQKLENHIEYLIELKSNGEENSVTFKTMHKNLSEIITSLKGQNIEMGNVNSLMEQKLSMPKKINSQIDKIFEKINKDLDGLNAEKFKSVCYRFLTKLGNNPTSTVEYQKILAEMEQNIKQYQNILNKIADNYSDNVIKTLSKDENKKRKNQFFNFGTTSNPKDGGYDSNQKEGQTLTFTYGRDDFDIIPFPKAKE